MNLIGRTEVDRDEVGILGVMKGNGSTRSI